VAWIQGERSARRHGGNRRGGGDGGQPESPFPRRRLQDGPSEYHSDPLEDQGAVRSAETERILERDADLQVTRGVGAVIEIALRILVEDIDRRRRDLVMDRQDP